MDIPIVARNVDRIMFTNGTNGIGAEIRIHAGLSFYAHLLCLCLLRLTICLLLFVLLLVFSQLLGEQLLELLILKLLFCLHKLGLVPDWRVRHERGSGCEQSDGEVECSDECAGRCVARKGL